MAMDGSFPHALEDTIASCYQTTGRLRAHTRRYAVAKRSLDIVGACGIAMVFSPVILTTLAIMALQKGPIFFGHKRVGRAGKSFNCYKFRTMVPNAHAVLQQLLDADPQAKAEWERDFKLKNDPRITRVGRVLRRTSLDELPQLWNVLKGDMSLVGPRPVVREELIRYGRGARFYLVNRPGLTGLWQVSGRNDVDYTRRVAMDRAYAENASFWMDVQIVLRTVLVVLRVKGKGAY